MNLGVWYIFDGDAKLVFDSDPDSVWSRLIARIEQRVERRRRRPWRDGRRLAALPRPEGLPPAPCWNLTDSGERLAGSFR